MPSPFFGDIGISIHAPARGATPKLILYFTSHNHFNPRSREGSDGTAPVNMVQNPISIHAPARGATIQPVHRSHLPSKFQSTLPRGERRPLVHATIIAHLFQSTLPRGERRLEGIADRNLSTDFNPRSREGSDCNFI